LLPVDQQITIDSELPNTPEWSLSAALDYEIFISSGSVVFHGDWGYKSDIENDGINSPFLSEGDTNIFNVSAGYVYGDNRWSVMLFGENITDERFITSGDSNYGVGFHEANFNRPREWGIKLSTEF